MVEKKAKKTNVQTSFEKKMGEAKVSMMETAGKVGEESKKVAGKVENRWKRSSTEEKICTCLGILLILLGLFAFDSVRKLIFPLILIILGVLLVTGFFNTSKK